MSLLFVFYYNPATKETVENVGIFPNVLQRSNEYKLSEKWLTGEEQDGEKA